MTPTLGLLFADGSPGAADFHTFYASNLRTGLFSGFLTLSGFLLAMKTLVVIQLRKELYDTKFYRARVRDRRKLNEELTVYGPLKRFGRLLLLAVSFSIATALAQFSIGLIAHTWAAVLCLALAGLTAIVLLCALSTLWANLGDLFAFWEEEAAEKMQAESSK
jgi:hypothetical protein